MNILIQDLQPLVGTAFTVHTQAGTLSLVLQEAVERPRRGLPEQFRTPISLVFAGPQQVQLTQDNYSLDHPVLGRVLWMLVPIGKFGAANPQQAPLYEAILG